MFMMKESIRERFLRDHRQIRGKASVLRSLALGVLRGDEELASALRLKGEDLQTHMLLHMTWEEDELMPALERGGGDENSLGKRIQEEHREQRTRLAHSLVALRVTREQKRADIERLAKEMLELVRWLEGDMAKEEDSVLRFISESGKQE
jgi:iron-sulfur cluster repair protein YtfE (RIC family)